MSTMLEEKFDSENTEKETPTEAHPPLNNENSSSTSLDSLVCQNSQVTILASSITEPSDDVVNNNNNNHNNDNGLNSNATPSVYNNSLLSRGEVRFIITLLVICNFLIANGVSLQGPFFPKEAESKGATPLIYSSIFAIYELVMLITSFIFGNLVEHFKPNLMSGFGLTITGLSTSVFGLLTYLNSELFFVLASFALRIIESLGATAFATSSYSFISACFPDQTGTMFAVMETFFGLGVITGPVLGGFLYDFGNFLAPFLAIGVVMTFCGVIIISHPVERLFAKGKENGHLKMITVNECDPIAEVGSGESETTNGVKLTEGDLENNPESNSLLTPINQSSDVGEQQTSVRPITLTLFLFSPIILLDALIIITAITLMGFNGATLEPFLRHQNISSSTLCTSLMFVAIGASYAFTALLWGKACDRYPKYLLHFSIVGSILTSIGVAFIGPLPFLQSHFSANLWTIFACLVLFGIGTASKQVAGYTHALNFTIKKRKFPPNQQTYGYISGMFFSCLSFGGFIGPIIGGGLVEQFNYQYATLVMFAIELIVLSILIVLQLCCPFYKL